MAKSKTISFGKGRRWLNPKSTDCKAGIVWSVEVSVHDNDNYDKPTAYLEAYMTTTEEAGSHWVYKRGDLAPVVVMETELAKYRRACEDALAHIKENDYNYRSH